MGSRTERLRLGQRVLHRRRAAEQARDGHTVAMHLYGAIIVLAVLMTADHYDSGPYRTAAVLAVTIAVLLSMETYAYVVGREISLRRRLTADERRATRRELMSVTGASELPLAFLVLAGLGLFTTEVALFLAKAVTVGELFHYSYLARRLAGRPADEAVRAGLLMSGVGIALAVGKGYVHL